MKFSRMIELLKKCAPNFKPYFRLNIAFIGLTQLNVFLGLMLPLLIRFLIDEVLTNGKWEYFTQTAVFISVAIGINSLLAIVTNIAYTHLSENITATSRDSLFSYILKKNLSFMNSVGDGEIVNRLIESPEYLPRVPSVYLERLITSIATILIVSTILFVIQPILAAISLISIPVFVFIYLKTRKVFFEHLQVARQEIGKLSAFYTDILRNFMQVKNNVTEDAEWNVSKERNANIRKAGMKAGYIGALTHNVLKIVTQFNQLGILLYGAWLIHSGGDDMTIGTLIAFYTYLGMLYSPLVSIINTLNDLNGALVDMERYLEFYNHDNEENYEGGIIVFPKSAGIEFKNIYFAYGENKVLSDVSFSVVPGDKVLLLGQSGVGKSTIIALIKRLYDPDKGSVLIGGKDISDYNLATLRKNIMYLTQDDYIFPATIRENFKRFNPEVMEEEIFSALNKAQLSRDFLKSRNIDLDYMIDKNAIAFSGGQRRRLSLALVFASKAPIVILDEPFTGLDRVTQDDLWREMKNHLDGKTLILIDHNFTDQSYFDRVLKCESNEIKFESVKN